MPSSDFRIPNQMLVTNSLNALQQSFAKLADLQDQASSLKRLRKPSDAPADVVSAMQLHAGIDRNDQYTRNLSDAQGWLGNADSALTGAVTQLQKVNDLVVQASNASTDANARAGIAAQIDQIRNSLIGIANTQYAGRPIFAGTASGNVAYDATGQFVGVSSAVERNIAPGQRIQVNVNGDTAFGPPGSDVFTTLAQISNAILTNPSQLTALQTTLATRTTQVQGQLAQVGSQFLRVQNMQSQNTSNGLTMKQNLSSIEDADIAQVMVQLQAQQVAYQAALSATARAIQPSLTDFLK
ncbi:MAG: Flagellar hook-associated protein FlgL [Actinomycetia bacterium]|jgi:flagellar hook-associated protein 3 FlgL|nr:Flagellar hook-associated protein FlgL [Actinomycetes bacterium]MDQ1461555.1 flagellar hook-associated protein 3 FlgL [Actinomycetota bacterium]